MSGRVPKTRRKRGFLALDAIGAIGLTMVLAVVFAAAYREFAVARRAADLRRDLRLAAEAELTRLRAAGLDAGMEEPLSKPARQVSDGLFVQVHVQPAAGAWEGMAHVTVVARQEVYGRWVAVELSAYVGVVGGQP